MTAPGGRKLFTLAFAWVGYNEPAMPQPPENVPDPKPIDQGPPDVPPGLSHDPPQKLFHQPTTDEINKMKAYRAEPFTAESDEHMPGGYKLMHYHQSPPWSWINPNGTKHTTSYETKEDAIAAANAQAYPS